MSNPLAQTRKNLSAREPNDFYQTPRECVTKLLSVERFGGKIWEPACGLGAISETLKDNGFEVISTDIEERGYGKGGCDFLWTFKAEAPTIITNPPFKDADDFLVHTFEHLPDVTKFAMFQRTAFLEGAARYEQLYRHYPPVRIWQFIRRYTLCRADDPDIKDKGSMIAYAWFIFERGNKNLPTLGWL
jgi:hypothetical protein